MQTNREKTTKNISEKKIRFQNPSIKKIKGKKYVWNINNLDIKIIKNISNYHKLCIPISEVLYSRGLKDKNAITDFLFGFFEKEVHDPTLLKNSKKAVDRIIQAINKKEKILIFGDYDVDGITSTALALISLIPLNANINYFLPNRMKDGYGISEKIVEKAHKNGYKLILTVDNGITAHNPIILANKYKIDVIVTDHHKEHETLPNAYAIINPNQSECSYPFKHLAGVGVIFKLICLLYKNLGKELPNKVYELLSLGTVADVVPLIGENRYWVRKGLSKINQEKSFALSVLSKNSNLTKSKLNSLDIGFMITPQINALGRLDDSRDAVTFLISSNQNIVKNIGKILKEKNDERKYLEQNIYDQIENAILEKTIDIEKENIIMAANSSWSPGIIGLVAGKLMHNFGKPTFIFHHDKKNNLMKGSCRSIKEFNIFDALVQCKDLLVSFGGHSFAAGLKLKTENVSLLKQKLEEIISKQVSKEDLQPKISIDATLSLSEAGFSFIKEMEQLEPFGNQNPQPIFLIKQVTLVKPATILKGKHVKCTVFADGIVKPIIFFNRPDLYKIINSIGDNAFDICGYVVKNEWNDNISIELQGLDIALQKEA